MKVRFTNTHGWFAPDWNLYGKGVKEVPDTFEVQCYENGKDGKIIAKTVNTIDVLPSSAEILEGPLTEPVVEKPRTLTAAEVRNSKDKSFAEFIANKD